MTAAAIKTVVYDVGGVLLDWDPHYVYDRVLGRAKAERFLKDVLPPEWNIAQDAGRPWHVALAEAMAAHPEHADNIMTFRKRWREFIPHTMPGAIGLLDELAGACVPLYAITNFSSDTFREACARFPLFQHFQGIAISGDLNCIKPDPRIYWHLREEFGLDLSSCVFIDDSLKNVVGARAVGMAGIHFTSTSALRRELAALGLPVRVSGDDTGVSAGAAV